MAAIKPLRLFVRSHNHDALGRLYVERVAQEKLEALLFSDSAHLIGKALLVDAVDNGTLENVYALALWRRARRHHHLLGDIHRLLFAVVSLVQNHQQPFAQLCKTGEQLSFFALRDATQKVLGTIELRVVELLVGSSLLNDHVAVLERRASRHVTRRQRAAASALCAQTYAKARTPPAQH